MNTFETYDGTTMNTYVVKLRGQGQLRNVSPLTEQTSGMLEAQCEAVETDEAFAVMEYGVRTPTFTVAARDPEEAVMTAQRTFGSMMSVC